MEESPGAAPARNRPPAAMIESPRSSGDLLTKNLEEPMQRFVVLSVILGLCVPVLAQSPESASDLLADLTLSWFSVKWSEAVFS